VLTTELVVTIPGHPAPKGSLKCIGGRGGRGHVLIEDNARTKIWRSTVAGWLTRAVPERFNAEKGQPIGAEITFTLPRPRGHYGTGRNSDVLKPNAPRHPVSHTTGDVDKLLRLALDALQDTPILPDDCAVIEVHTSKAYPRTAREAWGDVLGYPGVVIRLYPIEDT
jgi:Holliday junction resolvase RusA-like endonuclease